MEACQLVSGLRAQGIGFWPHACCVAIRVLGF